MATSLYAGGTINPADEKILGTWGGTDTLPTSLTKGTTPSTDAVNNQTTNTLSTTYPADYQKQYEAALGLVKNQYQTQRDNLAEQQAALPYDYEKQRNATYDTAAQTNKSLDELNAQRGLYRSGQARTDTARTLATRDAGVNDLNNQQTLAAQKLTNQLNQLNASEATDIASLQGQQGAADRQYALSEAGLTGLYNGQQTLAAKQLAQQLATSEAALTGLYNGQQTLDAKNQAASIDYNNKQLLLSQLQSLLNYNLGVGEITDALPQTTGFTYGDAMAKLLRQIYGLS